MPGMWGQAKIDDDRQREKRDAILVPGFYELFFPGRFILLDKGYIADILQQRYGIDTLVGDELGAVMGIQEKIVEFKHYKYESFFLETKSCTVPGHERDGWMVTSKADKLLYCFSTEAGDLKCWLIDLPKLQAWFWAPIVRGGKLKPRAESYHLHRMEGEEHPNHAEGRLVPIADVHRAVPTWPKREPFCCPGGR